jgi:hypothetical protein
MLQLFSITLLARLLMVILFEVREALRVDVPDRVNQLGSQVKEEGGLKLGLVFS